MKYSRQVHRTRRNHVTERRAVFTMLKNRRKMRIEGIPTISYRVSLATWIAISQKIRSFA